MGLDGGRWHTRAVEADVRIDLQQPLAKAGRAFAAGPRRGWRPGIGDEHERIVFKVKRTAMLVEILVALVGIPAVAAND